MSEYTAQDLIDEVQTILDNNDLPDRHSFFQIEKFIIGKEPTFQAQLWQIVREMQVRTETIANYQHELEDAEDELELFDVQVERLNRRIEMLKTCSFAQDHPDGQNQDLNIQESEINIRKLLRKKESLVKAARKVRKKLKCTIEELAFLNAGYNQIVKKYGEPPRFDDEKAQKEMWNERLLEEFNLRAILQRPLDPEFIKTVLCLGDEAPVKKHVTALIETIQKKMLEVKKG